MPRYNPRPTPGRNPKTFAQVVGVNYPQSTVDFVIPNLLRDLEFGLCITVALARDHVSPHVRAMYQTASEFFTRLKDLLDRAARGDPTALIAAERMTYFPEAQEIRFGYTSEGSDGNGIG